MTSSTESTKSTKSTENTADTSAPDPARTEDLARRLAADLEGEVRFDDYSRHLFARDASMYAITPLGVVFPRHADDVQAAVAAAAAHGVSVVPRLSLIHI